MINVAEEYNYIERAVLVTIKFPALSFDEINEHLDELELLAVTAGANTIAKFIQSLDKPNPATYIGKGKLYEIQQFVEENDIDLIIFDEELTPTQTRNLQNILNRKVIDRTSLILSIFAKHAKTKEAKLQVELAQSTYMLSRLTRLWTHLSKQYGGIGTKGPGETQLETDRRILKDRIALLKEKIQKIETEHKTKSSNRSEIFKCSLVGYTNAGKSTIMNLLTNANVLAEDKLFATLDSTTRYCKFENKEFLLSDTVGFIRKLPHNLIASFRSTLKEVELADLILIVIDISHPFFEDHIKVVLDTLKELNCDKKDKLFVLNKFDVLKDKNKIEEIIVKYPQSVIISAKEKLNINQLLNKIKESIEKQSKFYQLRINAGNGKLLSKIYNLCDVKSVNYDGDTVIIDFVCSEEVFNTLSK